MNTIYCINICNSGLYYIYSKDSYGCYKEMNIETIKSVYFVGAGGIGMSALVRYFLSKGKVVAGYDRTPTPLTENLIAEGAQIHYEENVDLIPEACKDKESTLVIYTPAVPQEHEELVYFRNNGFEIQKRAQVLGTITHSSKGLCVAGTHGKTTTSTMTAHLFHQSHVECTAFLGGISKNYGTNLLLSQASPYTVIEADEFDRSFHWLSPYMTVITSTDPDHLDIYGDLKHVHEAFQAFAGQVSGTVITKLGLDITPNHTKARIMRYSYNDPRADFYADNLRKDECGYFTFNLKYPDGVIKDCRVGVPGWVNVENAVAASAIAIVYGIDPEAIRHALGTFLGVKRRFDIHVNRPGCAYIDDYAHHPTEIAATLHAAANYPHKTLWCVFQPHTYTRTNAFMKDFAKALSLADKVVLADIYAARETDTLGISSETLQTEIRALGHECYYFPSFDEIENFLLENCINGDLLITMGAGDVVKIGENLLGK